MKTISIKSPNLEYYLAAEKCEKALRDFLSAYVALHDAVPPLFVEISDMNDFGHDMESHLSCYIKALNDE